MFRIKLTSFVCSSAEHISTVFTLHVYHTAAPMRTSAPLTFAFATVGTMGHVIAATIESRLTKARGSALTTLKPQFLPLLQLITCPRSNLFY